MKITMKSYIQVRNLFNFSHVLAQIDVLLIFKHLSEIFRNIYIPPFHRTSVMVKSYILDFKKLKQQPVFQKQVFFFWPGLYFLLICFLFSFISGA